MKRKEQLTRTLGAQRRLAALSPSMASSTGRSLGGWMLGASQWVEGWSFSVVTYFFRSFGKPHISLSLDSTMTFHRRYFPRAIPKIQICAWLLNDDCQHQWVLLGMLSPAPAGGWQRRVRANLPWASCRRTTLVGSYYKITFLSHQTYQGHKYTGANSSQDQEFKKNKNLQAHIMVTDLY